MTTLDDKLLGEKLQYYYSSSEDEDDHKDKDRSSGALAGSPLPANAKAGEGFSINTGTGNPWALGTDLKMSGKYVSVGSLLMKSLSFQPHFQRFDVVISLRILLAIVLLHNTNMCDSTTAVNTDWPEFESSN